MGDKKMGDSPSEQKCSLKKDDSLKRLDEIKRLNIAVADEWVKKESFLCVKSVEFRADEMSY
jgi:hypothetical protein